MNARPHLAPRRITTALATMTAAVLVTAPAGAASTDVASSVLLPAVDQVIRIVRDDTSSGLGLKPARRSACTILETVIDVPEAARRALGPQWQARTHPERAEFIAIFKDLMTYSYVATFETPLGQSVRLVAESGDDDFTSVLTKMQGGSWRPSSMEYRMHRRDGRCLVYDVLVDDVSLVGNFRTQFNSIIPASSYAELLRRMRERVSELMAVPPASADSSMQRDRSQAPLHGWLYQILIRSVR